jgi:TolB-like protein
MDFDFKGYFRELQRRHVVKAGLAYLVGAWLLVQVLDILLDAFELGPGWMQTTIIALSVGFPIWLIIAWVYDFSPKGIKKNRFIIGGLSIAVILLIVNTFRITGEMEKMQDGVLTTDFKSSIAVLALADISPNKDQKYFSDGLSRSIYDHLARYKKLKVVSPTSSFYYKDKDVSFDVIAEELDVAYILEGSVQRYEDSFRVSINLIDTRDGTTIWSKTFDDKIEDILKIHDEIASTVAQYLKLTLEVPDVHIRKVDPEAYELYLRAEDTLRDWTEKGALAADSLIRESLRIDPTYSKSQTALSMTTLHKGLYHKHYTLEEAVEIGLSAAEKALELDSTNVIAMNWVSNWQWHNREGTKSLKSLEKVLKNNPNAAEAYHYASHAFTRFGMPSRATEYVYKGIELSPKNNELYKWAWQLERYHGNNKKGAELYAKSIELRKKQLGIEPYTDELALFYYYNGDLNKAIETLAQEEDLYWRLKTGIAIALYEGNRDQASDLLEAFLNLPQEQIKESTEDPNLGWHNFILATFYALQEDSDKAFKSLDQAWDYLLTYTEDLWVTPEFKSLHTDPRWSDLLNRLGKEFNFDYNTE